MNLFYKGRAVGKREDLSLALSWILSQIRVHLQDTKQEGWYLYIFAQT